LQALFSFGMSEKILSLIRGFIRELL
jgi:hypothetical protein